MIYKQLNEQFSVSDQITVDDIAEIASHGADIVMCNRPDDEEPNQPKYADIKKAVEAHGMEAELLDFSSYHIDDVHRDMLMPFIKTGKKIHLYCRTGSRSTRLWRSTVHLTMSEPETV